MLDLAGDRGRVHCEVVRRQAGRHAHPGRRGERNRL